MATVKVRGWNNSVGTLAGLVYRHPQTAYAILKNSLSKKKDFVQRITPRFVEAFHPAEEVISQ